jgi:hypothetical protein
LLFYLFFALFYYHFLSYSSLSNNLLQYRPVLKNRLHEIPVFISQNT